MVDHDKLIKSTRSLIILFSIATLIAIMSFSWLGIHEYNSMKEIKHIMNSGAKERQAQKNVSPKNNITPELQSHLNNQLQTSYSIFAIISTSILLLALAWLLTFLYLRRFKSVKSNEQQLEELLYYDHISKLHETTSGIEQLPNPIIKMQLNRDEFFSALQQALKNNEFILYYQPIINTYNGEISDVEALIRWQHPIYGLLSPSVFLPLCENSGLIIPMGEWVLQSACKQMKKWHDMGYSQLCISINLSTRQLKHSELLQLITETLTLNKLPPSCLKLEITEDSLMTDIEASIKLLKSLRHLGLQLSLDDFGTGYSYLKYLKQLPISNLKIDKSFIHDMTTNITSLGIVESVIALGKSLGLTITAEGVENKNQLHMLNKMECDLVQGFLYSKPISADEFTQLLQASNKHANKSHRLLYEANYQYEVLNDKHYDPVVDVISRTFCEDEPMTKYLGITQNAIIPFAQLIVEKAIKDGLSVVALENNKVVACTIVEDMADPLNLAIEIDPRFKIIFSLLEHLGTDFFNERVPDKGHIAHLFITAVDKNYHGQGLSIKINFESIRLAKDKKFDFMCCKFTDAYNERGTVKNIQNSKLLIRSCIYKDFIYEGKKPFENLKGAASAYIWELREGAQLRYKINADIPTN